MDNYWLHGELVQYPSLKMQICMRLYVSVWCRRVISKIFAAVHVVEWLIPHTLPETPEPWAWLANLVLGIGYVPSFESTVFDNRVMGE